MTGSEIGLEPRITAFSIRRMWRWLIGLLVVLPAFGNPVARPRYEIVAENVLVTVSDKLAIVTGTYRFRVASFARDYLKNEPQPFYVELPVPVAKDALLDQELKKLIQPTMTYNGATVDLIDEPLRYYPDILLPDEIRLAAFNFQVLRVSTSEVDVRIRYIQPIINVGGKEMVYYLPILEGSVRSESQLSAAMRVTFETFGDVAIRLITPNLNVVRSDRSVVSVSPRHLELIGVERTFLQKLEAAESKKR